MTNLKNNIDGFLIWLKKKLFTKCFIQYSKKRISICFAITTPNNVYLRISHCGILFTTLLCF